MRKRVMFFALATLFALVLMPSAAYATDGIRVTIDGQQVNFESQGPVIVDGRTLVPVRAVFEKLGFEVGWDASGQIIIANNQHTLAVNVGSDVFTANGITHHLDAPAQIIGGSTLVPIRALLEQVGMSLNWDDAARTVVISSVPGLDIIGSRLAMGSTRRLFVDGEGVLWASTHNSHIIRNNDDWSRVMDDVAVVSASGGVYLAITTDGVLWGWGTNTSGQLGDGSFTNRQTPVQIKSDVVYTSTNGRLTIAITSDNALWIWGVNGSAFTMPDGYIFGMREISPDVWGLTRAQNTSTPFRMLENVQHASLSADVEQVYVLTEGGILTMWRYGVHRWENYIFHSQHLADNVQFAVAASAGNPLILTYDGMLKTATHTPIAENVATMSSNRFLTNNNTFYHRSSDGHIRLMTNVYQISECGSLAMTPDGRVWFFDAVIGQRTPAFNPRIIRL